MKVTAKDTVKLQKALEKHKDSSTDAPLSQLSDGRIVVEEVIDEKNHLHYIVRNLDGTLKIEDAQGVHVTAILRPRTKIVVTKTIVNETPVSSTPDPTSSDTSSPNIPST